MDKIEARLEEFRAQGWSDLELYGADPDDPAHGHHGLAWWLDPEQEIGRIGRWWIELVGAPDGSGVRASLTHPRRRQGEMLAAAPEHAREILQEQRRISA